MISNQRPTILYTIVNGVPVPAGSVIIGGGGQLIFTPAGGTPLVSTSLVALASLAALLALPSVGLTLGTTYAVQNGTILGFFTLIAGNSGNVPNDYNASTNNVSWLQTL